MKKTLLSAAAFLAATVSFGQQMADAASHSPYILAVDEYVPAPGQFVNTMPEYKEGDDAAAMARKCTEALAGNKGTMITLGAFGGYVTFRFDHSIANVKGQNDLYLKGNAFAGSAEPGVVMVSKDVNRNGIADDAWYEIAGSCDRDSLAKLTFGYEVTYKFDALKNVAWTDNKGGSGTVDRNQWHRQEYFPLWLSAGDLKLKGTLLPKNAVDKSGSGTYWVQSAFDYGYVDNKANTDSAACSVNFEWAVDPITRDTVALDFVDFVRVYNGNQQMAGWLGETSTEFAGAEDLHLEASLAAIKEANSDVVTFEEFALNADSVLDKSEDEPYFQSRGFNFNYSYFPEVFWSGVTVSGRTDTTFVDYKLGQYNSCVGHGYEGSSKFGVVFQQGETIDVLDLSDGGKVIKGMYVAANSYVQNAILVGDNMTPGAFGKGDYYTISIIGIDIDGETTDTLTYALADYRSENEADHFYVKDWSYLDLSALGKVASITFRTDGTRKNDWGLTTPSYFLMDNFNAEYDGTSTKLSLFEKTTTGIDRVAGKGSATVVGYYTVDGKRLAAPAKGLNLVKYSDGRVVKLLKK